jgi:hypothetical protein
MLLLSSCLDAVSLAKRACQVFGYWLIIGALVVAAAAVIGLDLRRGGARARGQPLSFGPWRLEVPLESQE